MDRAKSAGEGRGGGMIYVDTVGLVVLVLR
jgi:hypothetical protein